MTNPDDMQQRGRALRSRAQGPKAEGIEALMRTLDPDLVEWSDAFIFGTVWSRSGLTFDERMLVAIASLTSLGQLEQLRNYLFGALHDGIDRARVQDTIAMVSIYAGFPRAISALKCWKEVLESYDERCEAGA